MQQLSSKERTALREKMQSEERLDAAIDALRRLIKGNKEGASFSASTSNLNLPVKGGVVRRYKGNMAEIVGRKGAAVCSIYEGKVVEVKRNRISGQYDVFVAHGEYITSYANLSAASVAKGAIVQKGQRIGTIGSAVNISTMEMEYKIVFGIYAPSPDVKMSAANCFKK
jgi:murein DD-endopeptidase MepM/ murein hydrolase activator NlpD